MQLEPWQEKMWCIPTVDAELVARMEDVLALYAEAPDERRPVVCCAATVVLELGRGDHRPARPASA
jgi:hypothetical protein